MKYDGQIDIATGLSAQAKNWKNTRVTWTELVSRLKEEHKTQETLKEFLAATKEEQSRIKDVGGYVGGYLEGGKRRSDTIKYRQLITLDIDFAHRDLWDDYQMLFGNAAVLHGTHRHCDTSPRFRLIMPLSRKCTPDEYVAIARKVAGTLGIGLFDRSTFETARLMFWPSNPRDVDYFFRFQDGPWLDADEILSSYTDWTDSSLWPTADREIKEIKNGAKRQEDPSLKKGIIGAFCRTYSITDAIETFLSDVYSPTAFSDRYTYTKGTTSAGLIVYDDKFAYSHHGTDPCGGKLCNSFDLVRIHKFGDLDGDTDKGSLPKSFIAMGDLARKDKKVKKIIASENLQDARYDFTEGSDIMETEEDLEWMQELEIDSKGGYKPIAQNLNLIFSHDSRLRGLFKHNDFDGKKYVFGTLPWRRVPYPEPVKNVDFAGVRNYVEIIYGIAAANKIEDSLELEFEKNHYHPVLDYLKSLDWDGTPRIDNLLIRYFGAKDNIYNREAIRKTLVGAVARVFTPGIKFDLVLTLISTTQGTGKSSFFRALGKSWFSDTFLSVNGKDAFEQLQGTWIMEMAELAGLKKADIESIKHFISKQEDIFRPAYARVSETFPRQCVFVATTNENAFLRDPSGNRRFMPVDIWNKKLIDNEELKEFLTNDYEIDQVWAEAVHLFRKGEKLYLSSESEKIATVEQSMHSEVDERRGIIEAYLDRLLPTNWDDMDIFERRNYLEDPLSSNGEIQRDYVCVAEIWCECLGKAKEDMDRYKTREINDILRGLDGWEQIGTTRTFPLYGKQKYYARKLD
jgi:predicted P-loop ATPase